MELIYTLSAAMGLGALHSLEPGHGKGVISAYLIATRGKAKDALIMGVLSAVTHTFSIVLLSLAASSFMQWLVPEKIADWIEWTAGLLITAIGLHMMYRYFRPSVIVLGKLFQTNRTEACEHHGHHHRTHEVPASLPRLAAIGFLTGIIPCPSAMAIFLASLGADNLRLGVLLVAAFSLGGAVTMSAIGILIVSTGAAIKSLDTVRFTRSLTLISSCFILGIGLFVLLQSFIFPNS